MSILEKEINLINRFNGDSEQSILIQYDTETTEITDLSGHADNLVFTGRNLLDSFSKLNRKLATNNYLALCNGARSDISLSGGLADVAGGAMVYVDDKEQGYPLVHIFDGCDKTKLDSQSLDFKA